MLFPKAGKRTYCKLAISTGGDLFRHIQLTRDHWCAGHFGPGKGRDGGGMGLWVLCQHSWGPGTEPLHKLVAACGILIQHKICFAVIKNSQVTLFFFFYSVKITKYNQFPSLLLSLAGLFVLSSLWTRPERKTAGRRKFFYLSKMLTQEN